MAKKKGKDKKGGDSHDAEREANLRGEFEKILKALCVEYKVQDELRQDLEGAFAVPEGQEPPIKKMLLAKEHDHRSIRALCDTIKGCRYEYLKELLLVNCGFGDKTASLIGQTIRYTLFERLELRDCGAGLKFSEALSEYLGNPMQCKLQKLLLDYNDLGSEGARLIAQGLQNNLTLKELSLQYCNIESKGGKYLGRMLHPLEDPANPGQPHPNPESKKPLELLVLTGNPLKCAGIGMLAQGLAKNRTLKKLNLENTSFGHNALATQALAEAVALCESLQSLNISGNLVGNKGAKELYTYLEPKRHLTELKMTHFVRGDLYGKLIVDMIKRNKDEKKPKKKKGKSKGKKK
mmetsp:Transcript_7272/g.11966  ORF Transcript_7272/g.11966 Transcript_7272/m.11966 type:complete len:350 (-) Transcript_7272:83-1132(-)